MLFWTIATEMRKSHERNPEGRPYIDIAADKILPAATVLGLIGALIVGHPEESSGFSPPPIQPAGLQSDKKETNPDIKADLVGCTSIRASKDGYYHGLACESQGDMFRKVGKTIYKDRVYGVFYVRADGSYKCGYGYDVLPTMSEKQVPNEAEEYCEYAQPRLDDRDNYSEDHNCPINKDSATDTCDDGTFETNIAKRCKGTKKRLYGNFTSYKKSIYNATGKDVDHPFSLIISDNQEVDSIHYRFQIKAAGKIGNMFVKAVVVRTDDVEQSLGWGIMRARCAPVDDRDGGPLVG